MTLPSSAVEWIFFVIMVVCVVGSLVGAIVIVGLVRYWLKQENRLSDNTPETLERIEGSLARLETHFGIKPERGDKVQKSEKDGRVEGKQ